MIVFSSFYIMPKLIEATWRILFSIKLTLMLANIPPPFLYIVLICKSPSLEPTKNVVQKHVFNPLELVLNFNIVFHPSKEENKNGLFYIWIYSSLKTGIIANNYKATLSLSSWTCLSLIYYNKVTKSTLFILYFRFKSAINLKEHKRRSYVLMRCSYFFFRKFFPIMKKRLVERLVGKDIQY